MMNIVKEEKDGKSILRCEGRLDATTTSRLETVLQELIDSGHQRILVDFNKLDYLSSAGMRLLLAMTKKLHNSQGKLVLTSVHADVMDIIKMAGFESILAIYMTEQEGLDNL